MLGPSVPEFRNPLTQRLYEMLDSRIFRLTREWQGTHEVEYVGRKGVSQRIAHRRWDRGGLVVKVEATNAEATEGWEDVSHEFKLRSRSS